MNNESIPAEEREIPKEFLTGAKHEAERQLELPEGHSYGETSRYAQFVDDFVSGAISAYHRISPVSAEPAKESRPKEDLVKFLDWWLLNYMNVKGATPNSTAIVVERYLSESK